MSSISTQLSEKAIQQTLSNCFVDSDQKPNIDRGYVQIVSIIDGKTYVKEIKVHLNQFLVLDLPDTVAKICFYPLNRKNQVTNFGELHKLALRKYPKPFEVKTTNMVYFQNWKDGRDSTQWVIQVIAPKP